VSTKNKSLAKILRGEERGRGNPSAAKNNPENNMFSGNAAKQTHGGPLAPSLIRTVTVGSGISPDHAPL
jgi:hypothetical protein